MNMEAPRRPHLPPPPKAPDLPARDKHAEDEGWLIGRGLLAQSLMLEEQGPERLIRLAAFVIGAMVMAFIVWAHFTSITEVTVASGEVSPVGSVKRVQHLEGGIVSKLNVTEGTRVEKGDVLIELEDAGIIPELDQLKTRLSGLELQAAQLRAFVSGMPFDLSRVDPDYRGLAKSQQDVLQAKLEANEAQAEVIRQQVAQRRNELELVRDQVAGNERQIEILKEQVGMRATLEKQGLISRVILLSDQRELARAESALAELRGKMRTSRDAIAEAESRLIEMNTRTRADASEQLANVAGEIAELNEAIRINEDRVARLKIRAPVTGVVQELQTETVGGVISPGSTVMNIIPHDAELLVEARITTSDIGFIYVGQKAVVKVTAYDFTRYGGIDGEIKTISPTTIEDEEGNTFYRAHLQLAKNYVGDDPEKNIVLPGMEAVADVRTGEKTLLEFLLKPVVKALEESFRER